MFLYHFKKFVEFIVPSKHMPIFILRPNYHFIHLSTQKYARYINNAWRTGGYCRLYRKLFILLPNLSLRHHGCGLPVGRHIGTASFECIVKWFRFGARFVAHAVGARLGMAADGGISVPAFVKIHTTKTKPAQTHGTLGHISTAFDWHLQNDPVTY